MISTFPAACLVALMYLYLLRLAVNPARTMFLALVYRSGVWSIPSAAVVNYFIYPEDKFFSFSMLCAVGVAIFVSDYLDK